MTAISLLVRKFIDNCSQSREFAISVIVHAILIVILGTMVIRGGIAIQEPPPTVPPSMARTFVQENDPAPEPPTSSKTAPGFVFTSPGATAQNSNSEIVDILRTTAPISPAIDAAPFPPVTAPPLSGEIMQPRPEGSNGLTRDVRDAIGGFTGGWRRPGGVYEFTACIGQYGGGNWDSTIRFRDGRIEAGGVSNLLYFMTENSRNKIKANHDKVRVIRLDSDEIFVIKPPFILLTGTKDFKLTEKEVDTLARYVQMGGCIWGDSSVPGPRSRFDVAFRREMKRVIPDKNEEFAPLAANHPIFRGGFFPDIKQPPPGLNSYREPVYALNLYGKVAVVYTANDYGDMWQTGLNKEGRIDLRKNAADSYVAINPAIWDNRDIYLRNINPESLASCFKFGTNVVVYLLDRWAEIGNAPTL